MRRADGKARSRRDSKESRGQKGVDGTETSRQVRNESTGEVQNFLDTNDTNLHKSNRAAGNRHRATTQKAKDFLECAGLPRWSNHIRQIRVIRVPYSSEPVPSTRTPARRLETQPVDSNGRLTSTRRDIGDRKIPMRQENLEPPLLLSLESHLIGPELFDHRRFVGVRRRCHRRIPERDRHAIVPA